MPTRVLSPRSGGTKPRPWNASPRRVAPAWRWAWRGNVFSSITWQGGGSSVFTQGPRRYSGDLEGTAEWTAHEYGPSIEYNGTDGDRVNFGDARPLAGATEFTILVHNRAKSLTDGGNHPLISKYQTTGDQRSWNFEHRPGSTRELSLVLSDDGANFDNIGTNDSAIGALDTWQTFAVRWKANDLAEFFVDARSVGTAASTTGALFDSSAELWTGSVAFSSDRVYDGFMDLHMVFDRWLSHAEIAQHARDPFGPFRRQRVVWVGSEGGTAPPPSDGLPIPVAMHHLRQQG